MSRRFLWPIAALYLFSPTQFPWYSLWILPFLAIQPQRSLLLLTALLPLYYLRYFFAARGLVEVHDMGIVWLEFVPVWCLLIWEGYRGRKDKVVGGKLLKKKRTSNVQHRMQNGKDEETEMSSKDRIITVY